MAEEAHSGVLIVEGCVVPNAVNGIGQFEWGEDCEGGCFEPHNGNWCANVRVCLVWNEVRVLERGHFREQGLLEE